MTILDLRDHRKEARYGSASSIQLYPRVDGIGIVTATSATFTVYAFDNTILQAATAVTPTAVTDVGSLLTMSIPAISTYQEDARVEVSFVYNAATYTDAVYFDVVRDPLGQSRVSLESLQSIQPNIVERIKAQGKRLDQSPEARASSIAHLARVELDGMLRSAVSADVGRMTPALALSSSSLGSSIATPDSFLRPRLIKDRDRLFAVEVRLALYVAYRADQRAAGDDDTGEGDAVAEQARYWLEAAQATFQMLAPLRYDIDDNGTVDTKIENIGRVVHMRRVQA